MTYIDYIYSMNLRLNYESTNYYHTGSGGGFLSITAYSIIALSIGPKRKALALAFAGIGTVAGSFAFPIIFQTLIQTYGWRGTFFIYSGFMFNAFVGAYVLKLCLSAEMKSVGQTGKRLFDVKVFSDTGFSSIHRCYFCLGNIW